MLVEDKNANGTANTAPIKVPIKAIQIVNVLFFEVNIVINELL